MNLDQIEMQAADKICDWLQSDDDPITLGERMKVKELVHAAIEETTAPLREALKTSEAATDELLVRAAHASEGINARQAKAIVDQLDEPQP